MGKIIELSHMVANQIAAGEVVERPASVIKELVENALDAGARNMEVRIKDGGFHHLVVQDDGTGIDEEDLGMAIKRYATSKLSTVSDLHSIATYGFRGEALPSIASVSHMTIISRTANAELGTKAVIKNGHICEQGNVSCALGTRVEVRDLFYNVPARLKFARSKRAETSEIDRLLRSLAFVHHDVAWKFYVDNSLAWSFDGADESVSHERATYLLGHDTQDFLHSLNVESDYLKISGVVASPAVVRRDARAMIFFVNDRLVQDTKLTIAIKSAFRTLLEVGRAPICAIKIRLAPDMVDVNVHPRKSQVRFQDERRVVSELIALMSGFLSTTPWLCQNQSITRDSLPTIQSEERKNDFSFSMSRAQEMPTSKSLGMVVNNRRSSALSHVDMFKPNPVLLARRFSDLLIIGQARSTYIVAESDDGLVLIDQHAAHERVLYEKIKNQKSLHNQSQILLIPISVPLSFSEMAIFEDYRNDFVELGLEIEPFGKDVLIIRSVPDFLYTADAVQLTRDLLHDYSAYGHATSRDRLFSHICATLACHAAIRAGTRLSDTEIKALLIELDDTDFAAHCPHGRPIVKSFHDSDVKKWFDRH